MQMQLATQSTGSAGLFQLEHGREQRQIEEHKLKDKQKRKELAKERQDALVNWFMFLACFDAFLWMIPLCGNSWHAKQFTGFGVKYLQIRTSLLSQEVEFTCGKNAVEDQVCKILSLMEGSHAILQAKGMSCSFSPTACQVMSQLYWSSYVPLFTFILAAAFQFLGALFLYYYWKVEPLTQIRRWAFNWWMAAAITGTVGLLLFSITTPNLSELPRGWMNSAVGGGWMKDAFGLKPVDDMPFGWCYILSWFSVLFSWGTIWAWAMLFKPKEEEYATELVREARRLSKMERVAQVAQTNQALERPSSYGLVPKGYYAELGTAGAL